MVTEQHLGRTGEPTLRDLSEALVADTGLITEYSRIWLDRRRLSQRARAVSTTSSESKHEARARFHFEEPLEFCFGVELDLI